MVRPCALLSPGHKGNAPCIRQAHVVSRVSTSEGTNGQGLIQVSRRGAEAQRVQEADPPSRWREGVRGWALLSGIAASLRGSSP